MVRAKRNLGEANVSLAAVQQEWKGLLETNVKRRIDKTITIPTVVVSVWFVHGR